MSIQSVSGNNPAWYTQAAGTQAAGSASQTGQTFAGDLNSLSQDISALQAAQQSGNQNQITLSQNALNQALQQLQSDIQGLQGHHHHHHYHGMSSGSGTSGAATASASTQSSAGINIQA